MRWVTSWDVPEWEIGTLVYLRWAPDQAPRKRVVIGLGKVGNTYSRNAVALYRLQAQHCEKDKLVLVVVVGKMVVSD